MAVRVATPGFSDAARYVANATQQGRHYLRESASLGIPTDLRDELGSVWEECRAPNWDGMGAAAVSQGTLRATYEFLELMPGDCSRPSIGAEPDGSLTVEWYRAPRRTISVSIGADGDLHYAALLGPNTRYGSEPFYGDIPDCILDLIRQVYAG